MKPMNDLISVEVCHQMSCINFFFLKSGAWENLENLNISLPKVKNCAEEKHPQWYCNQLGDTTYWLDIVRLAHMGRTGNEKQLNESAISTLWK